MHLFAQANGSGEGFAACFPLVVMAALLVALVLITMSASAAYHKTLSHVATHFGGRVVRAGLFQGHSSVHFTHGGHPATIRFSHAGKNSYYTHVEFQWTGPSFRCEVYPEGILAGLRRLMGMKDIAIGSPQFDNAFIINGDDEAAIRSLLNGPVQTAVFNLSHYAAGLHVQFGPRSLIVTCKGLTRSFARLTRFATLCGELFDAAVIAQGQGIEFLDGAATTPRAGSAADARCMVCGETLAGEVVYCRACKTPHHRECWSYGGGCSTYGCGEKRFAGKG